MTCIVGWRRYKVFVTIDGGERQAMNTVQTSLVNPETVLLDRLFDARGASDFSLTRSLSLTCSRLRFR